MPPPFAPGSVIIGELPDGVGGEQRGRRPAVVISSAEYSDVMGTKAIVVPCTTRDRSWPNHLELEGVTGLPRRTFAMTEQVTTIDAQRVLRVTGTVNSMTLAEIRRWVSRWIWS